MIIPIAVYNYFIHNTPIEDTINNHTDLLDFCIGSRAKSNSWFETRGVQDGNVVRQKLSKTIRYYISNTGLSLYKMYNDGRESTVNVHPQKGKTWYQTVINKLPDNMSVDNVNKSYYIAEAKKMLHNIQTNQLNLF